MKKTRDGILHVRLYRDELDDLARGARVAGQSVAEFARRGLWLHSYENRHPTERVDGWACVHGERGHELPSDYEEVKRRLSLGSEELGAVDVTDKSFLDAVVNSLHWDFGAGIEHILTDQWSSITSSGYGPGYEHDNEGAPKFNTYIQCDYVIDGLAATWLAWANRFGFPDEGPESTWSVDDDGRRHFVAGPDLTRCLAVKQGTYSASDPRGLPRCLLIKDHDRQHQHPVSYIEKWD